MSNQWAESKRANFLGWWVFRSLNNSTLNRYICHVPTLFHFDWIFFSRLYCVVRIYDWLTTVYSRSEFFFERNDSISKWSVRLWTRYMRCRLLMKLMLFFCLFQTLFEIIDQWIASRWNDSVKWNNTPYRSLIDSNLRVSMSLRVFFYIINSIWSELRSIVESFHSWDSNFLHSLWGNLFQRIQQLTLSHLIIISRHY